jgi:ABC-2 type transport system ATP-binding protein
VIKVKAVEKRYGSFQALKPIDLHVRKGEVFGFLGPNGAGKTTLIRMLAGVMPPTTGTAEIGGFSMASDAIAAKRIVGYIPDRPYLYEKLTAREMLRFIGGIYGVTSEEIEGRGEELLTEFGLSQVGDQLVEGFSHGMKQRLTFCAALLHRPQLVIVDEPMVGLDPQGARLAKNLFRKLADEGNTVFLSTHSLDVAQEVCDRLVIINKGAIVAMGSYTEIRSSAHPDATGLEDVFMRLMSEESDVSQATEKHDAGAKK